MFEEIFNVLSNLSIFIILVALCVIFLIIPGIYLLIRKHQFNYLTNGTIVNSNCNRSQFNNNTNICNLTVNYPANNRQYTGVNIDEAGNYSTGDNVPVYYSGDAPRSFIIKNYRLKTTGIVLITLGIIFILMLFTSYRFSA
jgi:hypothetical protein